MVGQRSGIIPQEAPGSAPIARCDFGILRAPPLDPVPWSLSTRSYPPAGSSPSSPTARARRPRRWPSATAGSWPCCRAPRRRPLRRAREVLDRPTHVLLPGLVNAHTHAAMVLLRGRAENLPLGPWLHDGSLAARAPLGRSRVRARRHRARDRRDAARRHHLFRRHAPVAGSGRADGGGVRTCGPAWGSSSPRPPTGWATTADEYIDRGMGLRDQYKGDPLISTHFAPHAPYSVSDAHAGARASPGGRARPAGRAAPARDGVGNRAERAEVRHAPARAPRGARARQPAAGRGAHDAGRRGGPRHARRMPAPASCIVPNRT